MREEPERKEVEERRVALRRAYGRLAEEDPSALVAGCCRGPEHGGEGVVDQATGGGGDAVAGSSLGCGDPVALARLRPGQTVLDLGSGSGLDCFRAAEEVGAEGAVIGVDMTPEMVRKARENAARLELPKVEFRLGVAEDLPVDTSSVDVVLSNCVVNLSPDKGQVFREVFRVLRPGGTLAITDMLLDGPLPEALLRQAPQVGAHLGVTTDQAGYVRAMEEAGFTDIQVRRAHTYTTFCEEDLERAAREGREVRLMVRIGETGETVGEMTLEGEYEATELPRSFSAEITARKPLDG
jgi:SAM-dependent methyltransferase